MANPIPLPTAMRVTKDGFSNIMALMLWQCLGRYTRPFWQMRLIGHRDPTQDASFFSNLGMVGLLVGH